MNRFFHRNQDASADQEPRFLAFFGRRRRTPASLDQPKFHPTQEALGLVVLVAVFVMIGIVFFTHIFAGR